MSGGRHPDPEDRIWESGSGQATKARSARAAERDVLARNAAARRRGGLAVRIGLGVVAATIVLFVVFLVSRGGTGSPSSPSADAFQVGNPGKGEAAPGFRLPAATGSSVDLSSYRGRTVLLYFQEGLGCEPCWKQLQDLNASKAQLEKLHISDVVTITSDPASLLAQKVADEHISTPVLSDPDLAVSRTYTANQYGMMGLTRDGHTFVVVGPDGNIRWRADYGGAPNYTMYVPMDQLLRVLGAGLGGS